MEFEPFLTKLPTPSTIFYEDPPVFYEALRILDNALDRPSTTLTLTLKQLIHSKLINLIKVVPSVNNVEQTAVVCKSLLNRIICWINSLPAYYSKDYITILHDISCQLPGHVRVPGSVFTFDGLAAKGIEHSLIRLLDVISRKLIGFYNDNMGNLDHILDTILFVVTVVDPRFLRTSMILSTVNELFPLIEAAGPIVPLQMYKVLHFLCVVTETVDRYQATLLKNLDELQMKLWKYVNEWLDSDFEAPIENEQIFRHSWVLDHVSIMNSLFRLKLALLILPRLNVGRGIEALKLRLEGKEAWLEASIEILEKKTGEQLLNGYIVHLDPDVEKAYGFGVTVDWIYSISKDLLDFHDLFEVRNEELPKAFYFARRLNSSEEKLRYYTFSGKLVGLALVYHLQIAFSFSKCLHVLLADNTITLEDLPEADLSLYDRMKELLTCPYSLYQEYTFQDNQDRKEGIKAYLRSEYVDGMKEEINCFIEGLDEVLGSNTRILFFKLLNFSDLEPLLCGTTELDVDEWKRHVVYGGSYTADDEAIRIFWMIVREMTPQEKLSLFTFWTSFRGLPIGGFSQMPTSLRIVNMADREAIDLLPEARTCARELYLPRYSSPEIMRTRLRTFASSDLVHVSFGFA